MNARLETLARAFAGRRVLVTGADGFIGSHLAETLAAFGAQTALFVRGTARLGCGTWAFRCLESSPERFDAILCGDIASPDTITQIRGWAPEIIFHLAAIAYVDYSFTHPAEVFQVNAVGTLHVLEAARGMPGMRRLILVSTSEVYGPATDGPINEDHPLQPTSPYAASKLAADRLAYAYRTTYGLPIVIVRPFNTYGPRHTYDVIPKFIRLALHGDPLPIHGDGSQSRDFSYITDTLEGLLLAGSHPSAEGGVFNLGTGCAVSVRSIAETIVRLAGSPSPIVHGPPRPAEVSCLRADIERARRVFGFDPQVSLEDGLRENIDWMRNRLCRDGLL